MSDVRRRYEHGRPRGMRPWQPGPTTRPVLDHVLAALDDFAGYLPVTNRQILYRLIGAYGYTKADEDRIERVVNLGRRAGLIPWTAIADGRATVNAPFQFADRAAFWRWAEREARLAQLHRQAGQRVYVELWTEAAGLVPQLAAVGHDYGVPVYSSSGFDTTTARYRCAERAVRRAPGRTIVLHVGDHDPHGVAAFNAHADDVETFAADLEAPGTVVVERLALTPEQIERHRVPAETLAPKVAVRKDGRPNTQPGGTWTGATAQVEALTPAQLAAEVRAELDAVVDLDRLGAVMAEEETFRAALAEQAARLANEGPTR